VYGSGAATDLMGDVLTTNNRGEGHFTVEVEVEEGATSFFADAYGPAGGGDTPTVTLPWSDASSAGA
jgi:hypothetical protein